MGDLYAAGGRWDLAEAQFKTETVLQPGDGEAAYKLGNALLQQGKVKEARAELLRSNRLRPHSAETLYLAGKTASLEGDGKEAEKAWVELLGIEKETALAAQAHFGLATLYRQQGNAAKAADEMKEYQRLQKVK